MNKESLQEWLKLGKITFWHPKILFHLQVTLKLSALEFTPQTTFFLQVSPNKISQNSDEILA